MNVHAAGVRGTASIAVGDVLRVLDNQETGPDRRKHLRVVLAIEGDRVVSVAICTDDGTEAHTCALAPREVHPRLQPKRSYVSYNDATVRSLAELVRNYPKHSTGGVRCPKATLDRIRAGACVDSMSRPWLVRMFCATARPPRILMG